MERNHWLEQADRKANLCALYLGLAYISVLAGISLCITVLVFG